tara:strand:+ start:958 stop:2133 length:1176 start_codon:yes stop_codon:yes gene_type:complete
MERQLRMGGGIMQVAPRQEYFLGGIGDAIKGAVKGVAKGVKGLLKSPIGKAAILGGLTFGVPGTQFGGLLGKGSLANIIGQKAMTQAPYAEGTGLKGLFQKFLGGEKTLGTTAKVFGGGTALGLVLEAAGLNTDNPNEMAAATRDIDSLKGYLRTGYKQLNPKADDNEVETFVEENTREYKSYGGRIGYAGGSEDEFMELVERLREQGFSQQEAIEEARERLSKNMAYGGRIGYAEGNSDQKQMAMIEDMLKRGMDMDTIKTLTGASDDMIQDRINFIKYGGAKVPIKKAYGGRIGYAMGTDEKVDQASGIMGLPQRTNKAGVKELDLRETGGFIPPVGIKEKADDIPAMLSNNEFVFTADAVRGMGNGNVNKGAQRMYDMMKTLEKGGRV